MKKKKIFKGIREINMFVYILDVCLIQYSQ